MSRYLLFSAFKRTKSVFKHEWHTEPDFFFKFKICSYKSSYWHLDDYSSKKKDVLSFFFLEMYILF